MQLAVQFHLSLSCLKMYDRRPGLVLPLHLASLLNNVSRSQISLQHRSFGWVAELRDAIHSAIPFFIELLNDAIARVAAVSALATLAKHVT
jgi:hypothetical protein